MKRCIVFTFTVLAFVRLQGCASAPEPQFACGVVSTAVGGRGDVTMSSPNLSGRDISPCRVPIPCAHLTEAQRKQVPRCKKWEEKPLLERILLHVIYLQ